MHKKIFFIILFVSNASLFSMQQVKYLRLARTTLMGCASVGIVAGISLVKRDASVQASLIGTKAQKNPAKYPKDSTISAFVVAQSLG